MKTSRTFASRFSLSLAFTLVIVAAIGCGTSTSEPPLRPTPEQLSGVAPAAPSAPQSSADFARCLGGNGGSACFNAASAGRIGAAVVSSAPIGLTATANGSTVTLTWTAPASGDAPTSYSVEAGSAPGLSNLADFNTGSRAASLTAPGVPNGTYFVRVRAVNASGVSLPSNEVTLVVGASGACAGPPRGLLVTSQSAGTISLAWSAPTTGSPTSYVIRAGSSPGLSNLADFDTNSAALSFVATGVPAGSYYARLYSRSDCGLSSPSNEALVFVVGFSGDVQVSVSWDAPSDVDLHVVEPSGEDVYYGSPTSASGGQLDVDSNAACRIDGRQIENVRWSSRAPAGSYTVRVDYWDSCNVARTNYLITVKNGSATSTFSGFFTGPGDNGGAGSGVTITTFVHAASLMAERVRELFKAPQLVTPSAKKPRASAGR